MSHWYRKLTSSCVSFTMYQQCQGNIEGNLTPISLQYQNVHWDTRVLNMPGFWIWQGSEVTKVTQASECVWISLDNLWISLIMSEYVRMLNTNSTLFQPVSLRSQFLPYLKNSVKKYLHFYVFDRVVNMLEILDIPGSWIWL